MKFSLLPLLLAILASSSLANVTITTLSLPNGTAKTPYSAVITASGGCTPDKWVIASGTLPPGVSSKVSGTTTALNLTGTPTTPASYSFTVKVTGCGGKSSQVTYNVVIQATANHVVNLGWNTSTTQDVVGYNVYRSLDGATWGKINVSLIGSTLYSDSTVANSTTYYYSATAVDIKGAESTKTPSVKASIP